MRCGLLYSKLIFQSTFFERILYIISDPLLFLVIQIIQVEQELLETQRKAGFPIHLPQDNSNTKLVSMPQILKMPPVSRGSSAQTELYGDNGISCSYHESRRLG